MSAVSAAVDPASLTEARPLPEVVGLDFLFHPQRTRAPRFYINRRRQILFLKSSRRHDADVAGNGSGNSSSSRSSSSRSSSDHRGHHRRLGEDDPLEQDPHDAQGALPPASSDSRSRSRSFAAGTGAGADEGDSAHLPATMTTAATPVQQPASGSRLGFSFRFPTQLLRGSPSAAEHAPSPAPSQHSAATSASSSERHASPSLLSIPMRPASSKSQLQPHALMRRPSDDTISDAGSSFRGVSSSAGSAEKMGLIDRLLKERRDRVRNAEPTTVATANKKIMELAPVNFKYLLLRQTLLARKFGAPSYLTNLIAASARGSVRSVRNSDEEDDATSIRSARRGKGKKGGKDNKMSTAPRITKTDQSPASRAIVGDTTLDENYAFVGVHNIFDQHRQPVTAIKFANNERTRFCCSSQDSFLSICLVDPPKIKFVLKGHRKGVTDFEWSTANDFIISCSLDKSVRLWDTKTGICLRTIADASEFLCCAFCPANNNFLLVGERKSSIQVFNLSTGKPQPNAATDAAPIKALAFDTAGTSVFAGDEQGTIHVFNISPETGKLTRVGKMTVSAGHAITSVSYSSWFSRERHDPSLLINCKDNMLRFYGVNMNRTDFLKLRNQYAIKQNTYDLRSTFCPLMSFRQGACIVTGSEDNNVYIFDVKSKERPLVNKLQGHSGPVLSVCWTYDESILGSSDTSGMVILWKRAVIKE